MFKFSKNWLEKLANEKIDDKDFDKITPLYEINENLFVKECSNGYYTDNLSKKGSIILYGKEPF